MCKTRLRKTGELSLACTFFFYSLCTFHMWLKEDSRPPLGTVGPTCRCIICRHGQDLLSSIQCNTCVVWEMPKRQSGKHRDSGGPGFRILSLQIALNQETLCMGVGVLGIGFFWDERSRGWESLGWSVWGKGFPLAVCSLAARLTHLVPSWVKAAQSQSCEGCFCRYGSAVGFQKMQLSAWHSADTWWKKTTLFWLFLFTM